MTNSTNSNENLDLGDDLEITKTTRRNSGGGAWMSGKILGHRFDALVFPDHADNPDYEIGASRPQGGCRPQGGSRISKLWIQRQQDKAVVYNWDRGQDVPPADPTAATIVDFLCAGLAEHTYGK